MGLLSRIKGFVKYRLKRPHNMFTHKAEQFYFQEYADVILPFILPGNALLDVGCQFGRFSIPAYQAGAQVTATDIHEKYFRFINTQLGENSIEFRLEDIETTCKTLPESSFDIILCLELLYNLPDPQEKIEALSRLLKPGGILITTHRTAGYYVYRFIREKKFDELMQLLSNSHPNYNAQTADELNRMYHNADLRVNQITPIGMFSGFGADAFSGIANPEKMTKEEKATLFQFETNAKLYSLFGENARYWLVVAGKA
jgi:2-polyprenyl-3-methyl-5-hydroxy-6-metoxy-1,4-benzoquinol methylase